MRKLFSHQEPCQGYLNSLKCHFSCISATRWVHYGRIIDKFNKSNFLLYIKIQQKWRDKTWCIMLDISSERVQSVTRTLFCVFTIDMSHTSSLGSLSKFSFREQLLWNNLNDIRNCMTKDKLKINDEKIELILIGSRSQLEKVQINSKVVGDLVVSCSNEPVPVGLGAWFNRNSTTMIIWQVREYLNRQMIEDLVHAFVTSRLEK